jgi:hypothetical protein
LFELPLFSTVLLNSSKLVINPHHGIPPDRNQVGIIGVDLPAFLLSKSMCPDPVRAPQHSAEGDCLPDDCRQLASPSITVADNKKPGVERRA